MLVRRIRTNTIPIPVGGWNTVYLFPFLKKTSDLIMSSLVFGSSRKMKEVSMRVQRSSINWNSWFRFRWGEIPFRFCGNWRDSKKRLRRYGSQTCLNAQCCLPENEKNKKTKITIAEKQRVAYACVCARARDAVLRASYRLRLRAVRPTTTCIHESWVGF